MRVNPNGTIPSLAASDLEQALVDSRQILEYIDNLRPTACGLQPQDSIQAERAQQIIELVHSPRMSTNLILLQARDPEEMRAKQSSMWKTFVNNRQHQLERWRSEYPKNKFYRQKLEENTSLYELYASGDVKTPAHQAFYKQSTAEYQDLAEGLTRLDNILTLPYAVGESVCNADLHAVPWLAHAMWGAGSNDIEDFEPLEKLIQISVPAFEIGRNVKTWWSAMTMRKSFKDVFPSLH